MALKNLLVHLDNGPRTGVRLEQATAIAAAHQARLVGLFAQLGVPHEVGVVRTWPSDAYRAAALASRRLFEQVTDGLAEAEWRDANRGSEPEVIRITTDLTRHFDLVVLGQHDESAPAPVPADLVEQVLLNSGRPGLVIPYVGAIKTLGRRPLFAWNHGPQAARAVNDALPLLTDVAKAFILSISPSDDLMKASANELIRHLECHGIRAEADFLAVTEIDLMDILLSRITDLSADLLVMGAYGHYGFPHLNPGSGTRFILRHMTVPVMLSH